MLEMSVEKSVKLIKNGYKFERFWKFFFLIVYFSSLFEIKVGVWDLLKLFLFGCIMMLVEERVLIIL